MRQVPETVSDHLVVWSGSCDPGSPVSTDVYFCRLQAGAPPAGGIHYSQTIKMVYLK